MVKQFNFVIYLVLIVIGFYFGKWLGAIGLVSIYFYFSQQRKKPPHTPASVSKNTDVTWAYQLLGVSQKADNQTIEKARKRLLNHYHPDKLVQASNEEKYRAEEKINEINQAYQTIKQDKGF